MRILNFIRYGLWVVLFAHFVCLYAQEKQGFLARRKALKEERLAAGKPFLSVLAGPGYTPETGLLLGGGFLYTFKTDRSDTAIQRSTIPINAFVSTRGNVGLAVRLRSFWSGDRFRFNLEMKAQDATDDYFGVGFRQNESIEKSDSTTEYKRRTYKFSPHFIYQFLPNYFVGILYDINYTRVRDPNPVMQTNADFIRYGNKNLNSGLGFTLSFDSRDLVVNAYRGLFIDLQTTFYRDHFGGDNDYNAFQFDARYYRQISRLGNTLAFQLYGRVTNGDVPYSDMTLIGGNDGLRGYVQGQYRDENGIYFLAEWRNMFLKNGNPGKHGMVVWLGSGTVAPTFDEIVEWIPNLGVGYRYEVQPRMNVRIDFGIGRSTSGLYFGFTEAF